MVSSSERGLEYSTFISGSPSGLNSCSKIAVCNSDEVDCLSNLSANVMGELYEQIDENKKIIIDRENDEFKYFKENLENGFNIIFYLENNKPIGYTKYRKTQGISDNIIIRLNFKITTKSSENTYIVNSLGGLKNISSKHFIGPELYNFTAKKEVLDNLNKSEYNFRYTNHIDKIDKENNLKTCANQTTKFTFKENNSIKQLNLGITENTLLDEKNTGFIRHQVGYIGLDLVIYSWVDNKFYIRSLIKTNTFGKPIIYSKSPVGYFTISDAKEILYFAGRFAICKTVDDKIKFFNTINRTWWDGEGNNIIIDSLDINNYIYELPNSNALSLSASEIIEYIPEISNTFLDIKNSTKWSSLYRKIGNWLVFKHSNITNFKGNMLVFTNPRCTIRIKEGEYKSLNILNDQSILVEYDKYYAIYGGNKIDYMTEFARNQFKTENDLSTKNINGCDITYCEDNDTEHLDLYNNGTIKIINKKSKIKDTPLELYRRNKYPYNNPNVPNILCTFGGLIFYEEKNILKVL